LIFRLTIAINCDQQTKRSGQNANALNFKAGGKKWQMLLSGCEAVKLTGYKIAKGFFLPLQQYT